MSVLLIIPPLIQPNTPYPSITLLTGFLRDKGIDAHQRDLSLDFLLKIFSKTGLTDIFQTVESSDKELSENSAFIFENRDFYIDTIDNVIRFLQQNDPTLAYRICSRNFLPEASRFENIENIQETFGTMGISDKAKHFATLYLEDLTDLIQDAIDPDFGLSRYAESLALSTTSFDALYSKLKNKPGLLDQYMLSIFEDYLKELQPKIVGFSVPFPGNVYGALLCGKYLKSKYPDTIIMMGGGFVNTELRQLKEKRVFECIDYICLDDGELPILHLVQKLLQRKIVPFVRTYSLVEGQIEYNPDSNIPDFTHNQTATPIFDGLSLNSYISVIEVANPMHRLWGDGRWNKLQIAHGCYWGQCSFCDTSLDYIKRYSTASVEILCDRIEHIIAETGQTGFHFVDEAAPPKILKDLAIELIRRNVNITWWANIRFEEYFSFDICELLAASGCIAVSGGIEVASERILNLINKGVTLPQIARATNNFSRNGVMVHAYLMYGFPTQTDQETIDSLEVVRQLFVNGCIESGFWHRFVMTVHSPVGKKPHLFNVKRKTNEPNIFANNDLSHSDPEGCDHNKYGEGLKAALFNYMHGMCFDFPLQRWFAFKVPQTTIPKNYIEKCIKRR